MIKQSPAKTKSFLKAINKAAMQKCNDIALQIEQTTNEEMQRAEEEASKDGHARIYAAKSKIEAHAKAEIAAYKKEKKIELCAKRADYQNDVFAAVTERLKAFTDSEDYERYLSESIDLVSGKLSNTVTVFTAPNDTVAAQIAKKHFPHAAIESDQSIRIGGYKYADSEKSICVDDTLDAALAGERDWFLSHAALRIDF